MVYLLYNLLLLLSSIFLVPYYLLRGLRYGKSRRGIRERLGYYAPAMIAACKGRRVIWIHAVSVGETRAAGPLLAELRKQYPEHLLLLSNVTETGHAVAQSSSDLDLAIFFPFDFSWAVRKALSLISPELIIIVETEIWPNFTRQARLQGIPLVLVNGRLSDRSFPRYRLVRFLLKPVLESFSSFCMQSQADAERIIALGAASESVENTGNLKFDHELKNIDSEEAARRREQFRLPPDLAVIVAGSTHDGEEQQLLAAYRGILERLDRAVLLVLIPRHPERKREVLGLLREQGFVNRLRSELKAEDPLLAGGGTSCWWIRSGKCWISTVWPIWFLSGAVWCRSAAITCLKQPCWPSRSCSARMSIISRRYRPN